MSRQHKHDSDTPQAPPSEPQFGQKSGTFHPAHPRVLKEVAQRLVEAAHAKCGRRRSPGGFHDTPIGQGGEVDDASVIVAEVVEWTPLHTEMWARMQKKQNLDTLPICRLFNLDSCG